jgi:hypothetical protein
MTEPTDVPHTPEPTPSDTPPPQLASAPLRPFSWWVKRFLICNPFYLVSAALLLYGFYLVSMDTGFLRDEIAQLCFNLSSLQTYELLLVATAIFLARRFVWYDSMLLVCLENMLVLVSFILITQAALIELRLVWVLCLGAGLVTLVRFGALRRFIAPLNFPQRLIPIGLTMLAANVALPLVYRILEQSKIGTRPDFGAAYYTDQCAWLLLLPALCGLAAFLPPTRNTGELLPQRGWLPTGWFSLWLAGTVVHLYCLDYVYEFSLTPKLTAPAVWVLLWVVQLRASPWLAGRAPAWRPVLLAAPSLATFLGAAEPRNEVFLLLTLFNAAIYGGVWLSRRGDRLVWHLLFFSLMAVVAGFPANANGRLFAGFDRPEAIGAAVAGYILFCAALSRSPKTGLGAAIMLGLFLSILVRRPDAPHWAFQAALIFLLLHSLRWVEAEHIGSGALRMMAGSLWVLHAGIWMHTGGAAWMVCCLAGPVLGVYVAVRLLGRRWGPLAIPLAAALVMLSGPGNLTADKLQSAPVGLLAVVGSFLLFGLGTLLAVTRRRWFA